MAWFPSSHTFPAVRVLRIRKVTFRSNLPAEPKHEVLREPPVQQGEAPISSSSPNQTTAMTVPNHQILFFLWNLPSSSAETRLPPACSVPQPGSQISPSEPHRNKSISSKKVSRQNDNP